MLVVLEFLNDVQLSPTMGIPGWLLSIHENQRCCTLLIQHVCGSVPAPDSLGTAQLMGSTQGRYEYMTKESPAPTLKAELEISSVLISSPGLSAQLSLWILSSLLLFLSSLSLHMFFIHQRARAQIQRSSLWVMSTLATLCCIQGTMCGSPEC